ncbi:hypothetical protein [Actinomycetospora sp. CA-053990]|uniref:hypothetical protein n=1 Tax=Actinomycetospora sp. CA-053990 TaxID=3239891 RepID=UPI003D8A140B
MPPAPPVVFPTAYYAALAALIPLVWITLVFEAKINQEPWPDHVRNDVHAVLVYLALQLIGLIGLPLMELGVLLTLRDQQPKWWVEQSVGRFLVVAVGQIVVPVIWRVVKQAVPERWHDGIVKWGGAALVVLAYFFAGGLLPWQGSL